MIVEKIEIGMLEYGKRDDAFSVQVVGRNLDTVEIQAFKIGDAKDGGIYTTVGVKYRLSGKAAARLASMIATASVEAGPAR